MEQVVVFDAAEFKKLFPKLQNISDELLSSYFNSACLLCDNTPRSIITDLDERKTLLYLLTCHIATLKEEGSDTAVGVLTNATQGKVSISLMPFKNANWYNSTQCGMIYWNATAKYRIGVRYYGWRQC